MYESIKNFNKQFSYQPVVENKEAKKGASGFIVNGMGGSALPAMVLKTWIPGLDVSINRTYDLSGFSRENLQNKLIILSSYSGNTEEVISVFNEAKKGGLNMAVVSTGGKLLSLAKENKTPYIELPKAGIQPRMALGFFIKAFLKLMDKEDELGKLNELENILSPALYEEKGKMLAQNSKDKVPVIYASDRNLSLAYIWKIKLNETGKIPAFYNVLPELNHNEMTGFDVMEPTKKLSVGFRFIILKDIDDNEMVLKRMEVLEKLYKDRGLDVEVVEIKEKNSWIKIFSSLLLADWFAYYTANAYGLEAEQVPMVEEFKKLI